MHAGLFVGFHFDLSVHDDEIESGAVPGFGVRVSGGVGLEGIWLRGIFSIIRGGAQKGPKRTFLGIFRDLTQHK